MSYGKVTGETLHAFYAFLAKGAVVGAAGAAAVSFGSKMVSRCYNSTQNKKVDAVASENLNDKQPNINLKDQVIEAGFVVLGGGATGIAVALILQSLAVVQAFRRSYSH